MFQDILLDIIKKSDELYEQIFTLKNNFNDDLNLNLYNYSSINVDFINSIKETFINKFQTLIEHMDNLNIADSNSETLFDPLCDIICDNDLSIFKLSVLHPDETIRQHLDKTKNILYRYISRRFADSDFYEQFKYSLSESKYKYKTYIIDFIRTLEKYLDESDNSKLNLEDSINKLNLEDSINHILTEYSTSNSININKNNNMGFTLWNNNVTILEINKNNNKYGYIYLDIYSRENKKMDENIILLTYKYNNILPVYCINYNFDININNDNDNDNDNDLITETQYSKFKDIVYNTLERITI